MLLFVLSALSASALQVDSLLAFLPGLKGEPRVDVLNKLAEKDPENSAKFATEALFLSENIKYAKGKAKSTEILGNHAYDNQQYENALDYLRTSNTIYESIKDTEGQLRTLNGLNYASFELKKYDDVIDYCMQMQQLAISVDNKLYLAYSYARLRRVRGEILNDLS